ncbi:MAG: hypothetical protein H0X24_08950 [Ktedonobacterales bacterium]|nr:hypothetical protein [Ktedonobacterales bacterium]
MIPTDAPSLGDVQALTQEYAQYGAYRGGLGNVLGGVVVILVYFLIYGNVSTSILLPIAIGSTALWLVGKEGIRRTMYRSFGTVRERWPVVLRSLHIINVTLLTLLGVWVWWSFINDGGHFAQHWLLLLGVTALPVVAWLFMRTLQELLIGSYLFLTCALASAGIAYIMSVVVFIPVLGSVAIVLGIIEHRQYGKLAQRLRGV